MVKKQETMLEYKTREDNAVIWWVLVTGTG